MKRFLLAALIAAGIHGVLLSSRVGWFSRTFHRAAHDPALSLTLVSLRSPVMTGTPTREEAVEIGKTAPAAPRKIERKPPRKPKAISKQKLPRGHAQSPKPKGVPKRVPAPRRPEIVSLRPVPMPNATSEEKRSSRSVKEEEADQSEQAEESGSVSEESVRDALADQPDLGHEAAPQGMPGTAALREGAPVMQAARPLYRKNPRPAYPRLARRRGYQGIVILEVLVGRDGTPGKVRVFRSSGYRSLDNAAVEAVERWSFAPGSENGNPVDMWVKIPVRFQLH